MSVSKVFRCYYSFQCTLLASSSSLQTINVKDQSWSILTWNFYFMVCEHVCEDIINILICSSDGTNRMAVRFSPLPSGLFVFDTQLFWCDTNTKSIKAVSLDSTAGQATLIRGKLMSRSQLIFYVDSIFCDWTVLIFQVLFFVFRQNFLAFITQELIIIGLPVWLLFKSQENWIGSNLNQRSSVPISKYEISLVWTHLCANT